MLIKTAFVRKIKGAGKGEWGTGGGENRTDKET